jgi:hypothetical protein
MNISPDVNLTAPSKRPPFKERFLSELKKGLFLSLYFGSWFCALTLLAATSLRERPIPEAIFGLALIKAALCAKFMLLGQAAYPIHYDKKNGLIPSLLKESLVYLLIVITLSWLEAGVDGLIHGKDFLKSLAAFGHGDPLHIFSLALVYWLIVLPLLLFLGIKMALGNVTTKEILLGPPKSSDD